MWDARGHHRGNLQVDQKSRLAKHFCTGTITSSRLHRHAKKKVAQRLWNLQVPMVWYTASLRLSGRRSSERYAFCSVTARFWRSTYVTDAGAGHVSYHCDVQKLLGAADEKSYLESAILCTIAQSRNTSWPKGVSSRPAKTTFRRTTTRRDHVSMIGHLDFRRCKYLSLLLRSLEE
jgi:hypothetical protein